MCKTTSKQKRGQSPNSALGGHNTGGGGGRGVEVTYNDVTIFHCFHKAGYKMPR